MSALLDTLLDPERRAECAKHDAPVERIAVQPHYWPQVAWRNADEPRRRRVDQPRASRFSDLEVTQ